MKGKALLSLAIVLSIAMAMMPLAQVNATGASMQVVFENGLNEITKAYDSSFVVTLKIFSSPPIVQWMAVISWDPDVLEIVNPDTDIVEGPFLKSQGSTMFLVKPPEPGLIPEMTCILLVAKTASGDGDLVYITFHAKGYTGSPSGVISIDNSAIIDAGGIELPHDRVNGLVHVPPPTATPPRASIKTPEDGAFVTVCTDVALDGSTSVDGIDTLPVVHTCPITEWKWEIDVGNDGTIDLTLYGVTSSFHCDGPGPVGITLTVTAPDTQPPSAPTYVDHDSHKHVIMQVMPAVGPAIDVYTEKGGIGPGGDYPFGWSDAFGPQEEVTVYAKVTYNEEPVEYKPVAFEMIMPNGVAADYRTAFTDANGTATTSFRVPWEGSNAEALFGDWSITGSVSISEVTVMDTCYFRFGYIVSIRDITVTGSPLKKGQTITIDVDLQSISMTSKDTFLTIVACDECGVPIGLAGGSFTVDPEDGIAMGYTITIPSWAFVGTGKIYVNVFTGIPQYGGVPYCPERFAPFIILKT
jgi:hypothetical protein